MLPSARTAAAAERGDAAAIAEVAAFGGRMLALDDMARKSLNAMIDPAGGDIDFECAMEHHSITDIMVKNTQRRMREAHLLAERNEPVRGTTKAAKRRAQRVRQLQRAELARAAAEGKAAAAAAEATGQAARTSSAIKIQSAWRARS